MICILVSSETLAEYFSIQKKNLPANSGWKASVLWVYHFISQGSYFTPQPSQIQSWFRTGGIPQRPYLRTKTFWWTLALRTSDLTILDQSFLGPGSCLVESSTWWHLRPVGPRSILQDVQKQRCSSRLRIVMVTKYIWPQFHPPPPQRDSKFTIWIVCSIVVQL